MMESNGSGGESWDGVLKLPMEVSVESTSVYREIWVFTDELFTSSWRSSSREKASVGDGVGISATGPSGTGDRRPGAVTTDWPLWVARKSSSLFWGWTSIQRG